MFFESNVWDETAAGPKLLGLSNPKKLAESALKQYGLWKYKDAHPDSLSGGEKSRLGIADITVSDQQLILLDEPEFGLDPKNWAEITDYLTDLKSRRTTIVVITQDFEAALFLCDRIALLDDGQVIKIDTAAGILGDEPLLQKSGLRPPPFSPLLKHFDGYLTKQIFIDSVSIKST